MEDRDTNIRVFLVMKIIFYSAANGKDNLA